MLQLARWLGAVLILLFSLMLGREYSRFTEKKKAELSGYIKALSNIEKMIAVCLAKPFEIFENFDCPPLEDCGFLPAVRSGEGLWSAFSSAEKSRLSKDANTILSEYFEGFGKGYAEREIARTRTAKGELEAIFLRESAEMDKSVRVSSAMLLGAAAGVMIFII